MPESPALFLVCSCGKRIKAAGAAPGRLGRCPNCAALLRVPEVPDAPNAPEPAVSHGATPVARKTDEDSLGENRLNFDAVSDIQAARRRERLARSRTESGTAGAGWVFEPPKSPERSPVVSLLYPFWDWPGVGLLAFTPPILAGLTFLMLRLSGYLLFLNFFSGPAFVLFLGAAVGAAVVLGHTCHHLCLFLIESASGSPGHPNRPDFDAFEALGYLGRWLWAGILGLAFGGGAAIVYWSGIGDVDRVRDRLAIALLFSLSAIGGPIALLASTLFQSVRAAGPLTVVRGWVRLNLAYVHPCLVAAVAIASTTFLAISVAGIESILAQAFLLWLVWSFALFGALATIRVLGLCQFRHADRLGWTRSRD